MLVKKKNPCCFPNFYLLPIYKIPLTPSLEGLRYNYSNAYRGMPPCVNTYRWERLSFLLLAITYIFLQVYQNSISIQREKLYPDLRPCGLPKYST